MDSKQASAPDARGSSLAFIQRYYGSAFSVDLLGAGSAG